MTDSAHLDKVAERMARVFHEAFTSGYWAPTWEELSDAQREQRSAAQRAVITDLQLTEETRTVRSICDMADPGIPERRWVSGWVRVDGGDQ